jgi:hypothetical protein
VHKRSLKPKTKDHRITEASSAHLKLKGEGDASRFYQKRILNKKIVCQRSLKPKTKDRQITEARSTHLMLKGKGDTFWFYLKRILNKQSVRK